jgi:hypothetical protein
VREILAMLALLVLVGLGELVEEEEVVLAEARSMEPRLLRLPLAMSCTEGLSPWALLPTCHTCFTLLLLDGRTTFANMVICPLSYTELRSVAWKLIGEGTKVALLEVTL